MGEWLDTTSVDTPKFWAILPVKPFKQAKSRLSGVLTPNEREALAIQLFHRSVGLLAGVRQLMGVMVISRDSVVLKMARDHGVHTIIESGQPELNQALGRATEAVAALGANGVFIMPADLPFITAADIEAMLHLGRYHQSVVIAPDGRRDGTNSMFLRPPNIIRLAYGVGSFDAHRKLAEEAGASVHVYESTRVALDIDMPADLEIYRASQADMPKSPVVT